MPPYTLNLEGQMVAEIGSHPLTLLQLLFELLALLLPRLDHQLIPRFVPRILSRARLNLNYESDELTPLMYHYI